MLKENKIQILGYLLSVQCIIYNFFLSKLMRISKFYEKENVSNKAAY